MDERQNGQNTGAAIMSQEWELTPDEEAALDNINAAPDLAVDAEDDEDSEPPPLPPGAHDDTAILQNLEHASRERHARASLGLSETLEGAEESLTLYGINRDNRGRYTYGKLNPEGAGGGHPARQGAQMAAHGRAAARAGGGGGGGRGRARAAAAPVQPHPVDMKAHAARQALIKAKQDKFNAAHDKKVAALQNKYDATRKAAGRLANEHGKVTDRLNRQWWRMHPAERDVLRQKQHDLHQKYLAKQVEYRAHRAALAQLKAEGPKRAPGVEKAPETKAWTHTATRQARAAAAAQAAQAALGATSHVTAENNAWKGGLKADHPPFTPDEFRAGLAAKVINPQHGINASFKATINGEDYIIKDVKTGATIQADRHGMVKVPDSARWEASAEAASPRIAEALGMGAHTVPTYAFDEGGHHYVAVKVLPGADQLRGHETSAAKALTTAKLQDLFVHEYLTGDFDRHGGNYLWQKGQNGEKGKVYQIDHGRSFRKLGAEPETWNESLKVWSEKLDLRGRGRAWNNHDAMKFSAARLARMVTPAREAKAVTILSRFRLSETIPQVHLRFEALRQLAADANPTITRLAQIARVIDNANPQP